MLEEHAETMRMVSAIIPCENAFVAGHLLGEATVDRIRRTGDETFASRTYRVMQILPDKIMEEAIEGFAKALFFGLYGDPRARSAQAGLYSDPTWAKRQQNAA